VKTLPVVKVEGLENETVIRPPVWQSAVGVNVGALMVAVLMVTTVVAEVLEQPAALVTTIA
jgi:hypothetical protein